MRSANKIAGDMHISARLADLAHEKVVKMSVPPASLISSPQLAHPPRHQSSPWSILSQHKP
jgi:hypothetical protein